MVAGECAPVTVPGDDEADRDTDREVSVRLELVVPCPLPEAVDDPDAEDPEPDDPVACSPPDVVATVTGVSGVVTGADGVVRPTLGTVTVVPGVPRWTPPNDTSVLGTLTSIAGTPTVSAETGGRRGTARGTRCERDGDRPDRRSTPAVTHQGLPLDRAILTSCTTPFIFGTVW